jgi:hypothetical protein
MLIIPRTSPGLDATPRNKIVHHLFAIIDGVPSSGSLEADFPKTPYRLDPKLLYPSTPSYVFPPEYVSLDTSDSHTSKPGRIQISQQDTAIPVLAGSSVAVRIVGIVHNPNPTMGINELDDRFQTFVPDLGLVEGRCGSDTVRHYSYTH